MLKALPFYAITAVGAMVAAPALAATYQLDSRFVVDSIEEDCTECDLSDEYGLEYDVGDFIDFSFLFTLPDAPDQQTPENVAFLDSSSVTISDPDDTIFFSDFLPPSLITLFDDGSGEEFGETGLFDGIAFRSSGEFTNDGLVEQFVSFAALFGNSDLFDDAFNPFDPAALIDGIDGAGFEVLTVSRSGTQVFALASTFSLESVSLSTVAVPLPASGVALIAGLGGLAALGRRRRRVA